LPKGTNCEPFTAKSFNISWTVFKPVPLDGMAISNSILPLTTTNTNKNYQSVKKKCLTRTAFVRGLAGTMAPMNLSNLSKIAVRSASLQSDLAYFDIMEHELCRLRVVLTVPNYYETITSYLDFTPALHGIALKFTDMIGNTFSGVFMPEDTALHSRESHANIIKMVISKSGYRGIPTEELIRNGKLVRFQSTTSTLTFEEYRRYAAKRKEAKKERASRASAEELLKSDRECEEKKRKTAEAEEAKEKKKTGRFWKK